MNDIPTFDVKSFDINKLKIQPLTKEMMTFQKNKEYKQNMTFVKYKINGEDRRCCFKTENIDLVSNPIIQYNEKNKKAFQFKNENDNSRCVLRIALDDNQESCNDLSNMFQQIDEYIEKNKEIIFPSENFEYNQKKKIFPPTYNETIKKPKENNNLTFKTFNSLKVKLIKDFSTEEITTKMFVLGSKEITPIKINSLADIERYVKAGATIKFVGEIDKLWFGLTGSTKTFGVGIKCQQILVSKLSKTRDIVYKGNFFENEKLNEEEEENEDDIADELVNKKIINKINIVKKKEEKEKEKENENEEEEEDEEEKEKEKDVLDLEKKKINSKKHKKKISIVQKKIENIDLDESLEDD